MSHVLTYSALDDLGFAAQAGRLAHVSAELDFAAEDIGPVFEFGHLARSGLLPQPDSTPWLNLNGVTPIYQASLRGGEWICPRTRRLGLYHTHSRRPSPEPTWIRFCLSMQHAAVEEGFPKAIASQLIAAIDELQSNIYEHSQASATGMVAFKASRARFEFVVWDSGIGVLRSLRSCPEYANLSDHGEALQLALKEGVSRFGQGSGHGLGFRPLFIGLTNLNGDLRFRSGDHALTMNGQFATVPTRLAQKPDITGLFISVSCRC